MVDSLSKVVSCVRTIWPFVLEQLDKHNKSFRRALKAFVGLAFHQSLLLLCNCQSGADEDKWQECRIMQYEVSRK